MELPPIGLHVARPDLRGPHWYGEVLGALRQQHFGPMPIRVDTTDAGSIDGSLEGAHGLDVGSTEFPYGVVIVRRADDQRVAIPCQNITGFILTPTNQGR